MKSTNYPIKHQLTDGIYNVYETFCDGTRKQLFRGLSNSSNNYSIFDVADFAKYTFDTSSINIPSLSGSKETIVKGLLGDQNEVRFLNGNWISVGINGYIAVSANGIDWTSNKVSDVSWQSVTFFKGLYIAVGTDGYISRSTDALEWSEPEQVSDFTFNSVANNDDQVIAVGNGATIYSSTDGAQWTRVLVRNITENIYTITFGGNRFVIGGTNFSAYSLSGSVWFQRASNYTYNEIRYNQTAGEFHAACGTHLGFSIDGDEWINIESSFNNNMKCLCPISNASLFTGTNGVVDIKYSNASGPGYDLNNTINSVDTDGSMYVAVGEGGFLAYATQQPLTADTWTFIIPKIMHSVIYANGYYYAVGEKGEIRRSPDGKEWTSTVVGSDWYDIAYGNGTFVIVGANGSYAVSTNGTNWTFGTIDPNVNFYAVTFGEGIFIAVGSLGYAASSTDGTTWTTKVVNGLTLRGITYHDGQFLTVGDRGIMSIGGTDINSWTAIPSIHGANLESIIYTDRWVTVGESGTVRYTNDPFGDWAVDYPVDDNLNDIAYSNGVYYIVGDNVILTTRDFETYDVSSVITSLNSIVVNGNNIVAVGEYITYSEVIDYGSYIVDSGLVKTITVGNTSYVVAYDYNTDYISEIGSKRLNNDPIRNELIIGQYASLSFYDEYCNSAKTITVSLNGAEILTESTSLRSVQFWFNTMLVEANDGDILTLTITTNSGVYEVEYKLIDRCKNRYVLYYLNKYGGIDSLIIKGQYRESFNNDSFRIDTFYDRSEPSNFQRRVIQNTAVRRWEFNTGTLNDEQAAKIDHLLLSPRIWVHDLETNLKFAANTSSQNFSVNKFIDDRRQPYYTINLEQSQDIIRR